MRPNWKDSASKPPPREIAERGHPQPSMLRTTPSRARKRKGGSGLLLVLVLAAVGIVGTAFAFDDGVRDRFASILTAGTESVSAHLPASGTDAAGERGFTVVTDSPELLDHQQLEEGRQLLVDYGLVNRPSKHIIEQWHMDLIEDCGGVPELYGALYQAVPEGYSAPRFVNLLWNPDQLQWAAHKGNDTVGGRITKDCRIVRTR